MVGAGAYCIADREVSGQGQHQGWLAYGFASKGCGSDVLAIKQSHVEMLGHIAGDRDFVGAGGVDDFSGIVIEAINFDAHPT